MNTTKKSVAIIGGGAAALMFAAQLDEKKFDITIYEKNAAVGRKLLVAGEGGFNLTHSENLEDFISRYTPASFFQPMLAAFKNTDLCNWLQSIGIETYIGTSKRIFPVKGIKPIDVLNAILGVLTKKGVTIKTKYTWEGWDDSEQLVFRDNSVASPSNQMYSVKADIVVFALGGGSWRVTGTDGSWTHYFAAKGIKVLPFQASNCAFEIKWKAEFIENAEGKSLKNVILKCGNKEKKGEVVITKFGLEGGAIYALSGAIREQLNQLGYAESFLDMKPSFSVLEIEHKLYNRGNKSLSKYLEEKLNINPVQLALLKNSLSKEEFISNEILAARIKNLPLIITATAPVDEAISTVGGISLEEIDPLLQLKKLPNHYVIGEMLDWDAPTGGYLLQGCFSMGHWVGRKLNR